MMWGAANKVVYSTTLKEVSSARTRIEPRFDVDEVRRLKQSSEHDVSIGGANLAGQAIEAGLIDVMHLFVTPVSVGGGTPALPEHLNWELELVNVDRFSSGVVHLEYHPLAE